MADCNHDCSNCQSKSLMAKANAGSKIKKIIAVASGKGGVGKSFVTSLLAVKMNNLGFKIGIMDADITGPSIPKSFHTTKMLQKSDNGMVPNVSKNGIKIVSANNLLEEETSPICLRGPLISATVKQFYTDVCWGEIDYLFVDMPPGTGDVSLTTYQSLPIEGVIIVSTPQDLVKMIVEKAIKMAHMMNIKILGLVENMSYIECEHCKKKISVFGESKIDEIAAHHDLRVLAKLPIDSKITKQIDNGNIEAADTHNLEYAAEILKEMLVNGK